jgi:hypothetical protein
MSVCLLIFQPTNCIGIASILLASPPPHRALTSGRSPRAMLAARRRLSRRRPRGRWPQRRPRRELAVRALCPRAAAVVAAAPLPLAQTAVAAAAKVGRAAPRRQLAAMGRRDNRYVGCGVWRRMHAVPGTQSAQGVGLGADDPSPLKTIAPHDTMVSSPEAQLLVGPGAGSLNIGARRRHAWLTAGMHGSLQACMAHCRHAWLTAGMRNL